MEKPADAFGIFSVRRSGKDKASEAVEALNWLSPAGASFVKGNAYVNILATGCEEAEVKKVAASAADKIDPPEGPLVPRGRPPAQGEPYPRERTLYPGKPGGGGGIALSGAGFLGLRDRQEPRGDGQVRAKGLPNSLSWTWGRRPRTSQVL